MILRFNVILLFSVLSVSSLSAETSLPVTSSQCRVTSVSTLPGITQITDLVTAAGKYYVVRRDGYINRLASPNFTDKGLLLDWSQKITTSGWEQGLLGLAFPPGSKSDDLFYIYYSARSSGDVVISEIRLEQDQANERELLRIPQPYANHNGGSLRFGPDGMLYAGIGDGGSGGDPHDNGQNLKNLYGTVIRIVPEANGELPYRIPSSNPYYKHASYRPEIYISGLRNPWRFDFAPDGKMYIADVGQNKFEEVSIASNGDNLGWRIQEGFACFVPSAGCKRAGLRQPLFAYGRDEGISITGGVVYHGNKIPALKDSFIFGDFGSGKIWALRLENGNTRVTELADTELSISTFGTLVDGELAIINYMAGEIYTLSCDKVAF